MNATVNRNGRGHTSHVADPDSYDTVRAGRTEPATRFATALEVGNSLGGTNASFHLKLRAVSDALEVFNRLDAFNELLDELGRPVRRLIPLLTCPRRAASLGHFHTIRILSEDATYLAARLRPFVDDLDRLASLVPQRTVAADAKTKSAGAGDGKSSDASRAESRAPRGAR